MVYLPKSLTSLWPARPHVTFKPPACGTPALRELVLLAAQIAALAALGAQLHAADRRMVELQAAALRW